MFETTTILFIFIAYVGMLLAVAFKVERLGPAGMPKRLAPVVYALSLAVYCTAWTFYGAVGGAARSGMLFTTIYIGPTLAAFLFPSLGRRLVRAKETEHAISLADFLSARYGKSQLVATLASVGALLGTVPYVALQLKSVTVTFDIITTATGPASQFLHRFAGFVLTGLIIVFTLIIGVRRIDPTERHQGMMAAVALESVVKLVAFLAVGVFACWGLFGGMGEVLSLAEEKNLFAPLAESVGFAGEGASAWTEWVGYLVLSMSAIFFLPRQFHVMVVECSDRGYLSKAMWLFPLYLFLITLFVLPLAMAGLLSGLDRHSADFFVLQLPLASGKPWLALLVFIGGLSASMSMIMVASMTMSVMIGNHIVLPLLERMKLHFLRRRLLLVRWFTVAGFIITGYAFFLLVGESHTLINMGVFSFAAALQFAPAAIGALYWKEASRSGAVAGLTSGFAVWFYTLILPSFVKSGWVGPSIVEQGPFSLAFLRPESLFGFSGLGPVSHAVFWSMAFNIGCFVMGSLMDTRKAGPLAGEVRSPDSCLADDSVPACMLVDLEPKARALEGIIQLYHEPETARKVMQEILEETGVVRRERVSVTKAADLAGAVENRLAGAVGPATAQRAMDEADIFSPLETAALSEAYGAMLAEMGLSPKELRKRVDYHKERGALFESHAEELKGKVAERDKEIQKRKRVEEALRQARKKYRDIFENAIEGIFQCDPKGGIIDCNPAFLQILGYEYSAEIKTVSAAFPEALMADSQDWARFVYLLKRDREVRFHEVEGRHRDGRRIWLSMSARAVFSEGDMLYIEGSIQDITERKKAREEVAELNLELERRVMERTAELEAANRELESFSYSVSHDLRTPLRGIDGFARVLVEDYGDVLDEEGQGYLERIMAGVGRMGELIDDILHLGQVSRAEMDREEVDLSRQVREIAEELEARDPDREVTFEIKDGLTALADPKLVRILLENLLGNAWKFTSREKRARISFSGEEREWRRVFRVEDNGAGFDMDYAHKLFTPFNRLHGVDEFEGTGIGLAIVRRVAERHGGVVWAEGESGGGAVFRFTLEP